MLTAICSLLTAGEEALRRSGVLYTVVRPGGLKSTPPQQDEIVAGKLWGALKCWRCLG